MELGALEGVRVVDLSRLLPGPFATQLLADYGADVVKVEEPGRGDYLRGFAPFAGEESRFFLNLNRNKRSVAVDLKQPRGRDIVLDLVAGADVLVESFRPGVAERLGLGPDACRKRNPRLVYCSVTGYGRTGPYAHLAGHDVNYLAVAGALGLVRDDRGRPVIPGFQVADVGGGALNACLGILMALVARQRTGEGQVVDAAMVDGVATWLVYRWAFHTAGDGAGEPYLSGEFPCYAVYETADGRFLAVGALEPQFWERLCTALGHAEWIPLQFSGGVDRDRLFDELGALFRTRTRDEWCRDLARVDCCVTPVMELGELADDPHWRERGLVRQMEIATGGAVSTLGFPVGLDRTPPAVRRRPPRLGEHTAEILGELGYPERDVAALFEGNVVA